jgi:cellulose synthase operon protein C
MKKISLLMVLIFGIAPSVNAANDSLRSRIRIQKKSKLMLNRPEEGDDFSAEKMDALNRRRRALILDIRRFIRESRSEDQKTELNLRLGGLYMEDYHAGLATAEIQYQRELEAYNKDKKKGKRQPKIDPTEANASLDKARSIYKDLAARFTKHPRRDEMLYFLALSSLDKGLSDEGMQYFRKLSEETPNSKYVNESLLQLGDYYFEKNQFPQAETYYDKIVQRKNKPLIPYAIYKKGWCAYNLQRTQAALNSFKWVIENEDRENGGSQIRLKNEALRDITLPFVDLKLVNESIEFFRSHGDPHHRRGLETMAGLYFETGDHKNSIAMNESLLTLDSNYSKNPNYDISIVEALRAKGDRGPAVQRLFARLPIYMENSNWYEINSTQPQVVKEAVAQFEEVARKYALEFHAEGQKTKNEALYAAAKVLYQKYLEFFPQTTHAPQIRFYLAEIQYREKHYIAAADNYYGVYKNPMAGNLRYDSIRYSLNALDHELNNERKKAGLSELSTKVTTKLKEAEDAVLEEVPYTPVETKFINVSGEYLEAYPKAKDAAEVLYEQAYLHYIHYDFVKAYKSFWQLVQVYPGHSTAYGSAYLILDVLNRKKDFPKLVLACQKFLATSAFKKPEFRSEVSNILRHAELKRIQTIEEKGEFKLAASEYVEYTKAYGPQDPALHEKALYNASVNYTKAGLLMDAVETQEQFLRKFQKSTLRENMLLQVAKTYENLATFEKAGYYFELFATQYPKNAQSKSALRLAGLYHWGAGNPKKAETTMRAFLASYPQDAKTVERDLMDVYEYQSAYDKEIQYYLNDRAGRGIPISQYVSDTLKIAELSARKNGRMNPQMMEEALKVSLKFQKDLVSSPRGVEALSKTLFWFANQREELFYRIKLALPQKQLEINLQRKLQLLKDLEKEYSRIATLGGGEWGLGAIYKTAALYRSMAQDVSQAPVPGELTAEQIEMYRGEVTKQMIKPFNEKAQALVAQCLDKAQEFNVMSSWTPKCYSLGGELDTTRYPTARTFFLPPAQVAIMLPQGQTKIPMGNHKKYVFPYESAALFHEGGERGIASIPSSNLPILYDGSRTMSDGSRAIPALLNYRTLANGRKDVLSKAFSSERPADARKITFAYLNLLRLNNPSRAVASIQEAILRDPSNHALHNLLGLSFMDAGNFPAAKVTWLSLVARGIKHYSIWNNLGVLAHFEGNETAAVEYFQEATTLEGAREAFTNLGFIALKHRNGFEAKKQFEKALEQSQDDASAQVGFAVAKLQNREFDSAKDALVDNVKRFKVDPYSRLALTYFVLDVDRDNLAAQSILNDYVQIAATIESDSLFREAIQESRRVVGSGPATGSSDGGLPTIGN